MLENQIVPLYLAKNSKGYSPEWIQYIKNSIAQIAPEFTMKRMLEDYIERFYSKEAKRSKLLVADNYKKAKEIAKDHLKNDKIIDEYTIGHYKK